MHRHLLTTVLMATLALPAPASGFMIAPSDEDDGLYVVVIEAAAGDHVPLATLPQLYRRFDSAAWSNGGLSFEWRYFRSPEQGRARLVFDDDGRAAMSVEFASDELADGDTVAVATAFVDAEGEAMHTLFASAHVDGDTFENGGQAHRSSALVEMTRDQWRRVAGFTFFTMKYYAIQKLDADGVADAMRRAVRRVTDGEGSEQWIGAAGG